MSWKGTARHVDIGPGQWVLETADGEKRPLYGEVPAAYADQKVVVKGDEVEGMGIAMTGASGIHITSIKLQ